MKGRKAGVLYAVLGDVGHSLRCVDAKEVPQLRTGCFQLLINRLGLEFQGLIDRMCPVQLDSGDCVVLVLPEYVRDDAVLAMVIAMRQVGLRVADRSLVVVSAAQLGVVARQGRLEQRAAMPLKAVAETPGHVLFSLLDDMLAWAIENGASDLHLNIFDVNEYADVAFTIRSRLKRPERFAEIAGEMMLELLAVVWMRIEGGNGAVFEAQREQQGRLKRWVSGRSISLRWASIASQHGPSVTLRLLGRELDLERQSLSTLGYGAEQLESFERAQLASGGAVILAGAVGSGKSTTLATLIRSLPRDRKVITLEDPIEFDLPNAVQCAVTSFGDGGADDARFDLKLRAIKRSAANDVLIGEVRDHGSARALSDLLLAGTNVYTTVHAGSAEQILYRLISPMLGVCPDLLCVPGVLKLLVYQVLLNALCSYCGWSVEDWLERTDRQSALGAKQSRIQAQRWLDAFLIKTEADPSDLRFRHPAGCEHCRALGATGSGYQATLMSAEIIEPHRIPGFDDWIRRYLMNGAYLKNSHETLDAQLHYESCQQVALRYVKQGRLDPREFEWRFGSIGVACGSNQVPVARVRS